MTVDEHLVQLVYPFNKLTAFLLDVLLSLGDTAQLQNSCHLRALFKPLASLMKRSLETKFVADKVY